MTLQLTPKVHYAAYSLSIQRPLPSMLIATPAAFSGVIHSSLVNCDPWSVLKISGGPNLLSASSSASTQKSARHRVR